MENTTEYKEEYTVWASKMTILVDNLGRPPYRTFCRVDYLRTESNGQYKAPVHAEGGPLKPKA